MSSRMEIAAAAVPTVNNHYNLSSKLKACEVTSKKIVGLLQRPLGKKHILCSLLQR